MITEGTQNFSPEYSAWLGKPVVVTQHIGMVPYSRRLLRFLRCWEVRQRLSGGRGNSETG